MHDGQRRSVLRSITDEQYYDIMNVLAIYPHITMNVSCGGIWLFTIKNHKYYFLFCLVFDDEDEHTITTGAVVTLTVHLHRENMSTLFNTETGVNTSSATNVLDEETNAEQIDEKEKVEKIFFSSFLLNIHMFLIDKWSIKISSYW